jgi:SH3 domain protein
MMFFVYRISCLFVLIFILASTAMAETLYVSDVLVVTVRDSKSNNYKTLETIQTNTPIEVLDQDSKFIRGKTPKGTVGFILKQYLTPNTPKTITIQRLEKELAKTQAALKKEQQRYQTDLGETDQLRAKVEELTTKLNTSGTELVNVQTAFKELTEDAQNVVELSEKNHQLTSENKQISQELQTLKKENDNFHRTNMIQWFIAGAAVFFGGWLIGKISRQKQRGFSRR